MKMIHFRTWKEHSRGLMFRKEPVEAFFVLKKPQKVKLHTWFVKYPIDIHFYDKDLKPIDSFYNVKPFTTGIKCNTLVSYIYERPNLF